MTRLATTFTRMHSAALRWIDGLWGYDVFIAHRRIDGAGYAGALSQALEARLIRSFLDVRVYKPGDSLARETIRNARKSTLFLLVGSPASVVVRANDWLELELKSYLDTHDEPKVVVVDFGGAISRVVDQSDHPLRRISDVLRIQADVVDLDRAPHSRLLAAVEDQLVGRRVERRRTRVFGTIALVMTLLLLAAIAAGIIARQQRAFAVANESRALAALAASVASTQPADALKLALAAWPRSVADTRPPLEITLSAISGVLGAERLPVREFGEEGRMPGAALVTGGRRVLAWSQDGTVRLWDVASGQPIQPVFKHGGQVIGARFLDNERILVSWSRDGIIRFWDAATGLQTRDPIETDGIEAVEFSPDERRLVPRPFSGNVLHLWDVKSGKSLGSPMEQGEVVWGVAFSADGKQLLSWGYGKTVRLWSGLDGSSLISPLQHRGSVDGSAFSRDGSKILTWSRDGAARLWDSSNGTELGAEMRHGGGVAGARFTRDEQRILSWSFDGTLHLWDAHRTEEIGPVMRHGTANVLISP